MTYMREDEKKENAKTKQKYRAERCNGCDTKSKKQKKNKLKELKSMKILLHKRCVNLCTYLYYFFFGKL